MSESQLGPRKFRCITHFMHRYRMHFDVVYCIMFQIYFHFVRRIHWCTGRHKTQHMLGETQNYLETTYQLASTFLRAHIQKQDICEQIPAHLPCKYLKFYTSRMTSVAKLLPNARMQLVITRRACSSFQYGVICEVREHWAVVIC